MFKVKDHKALVKRVDDLEKRLSEIAGKVQKLG